jgi:NAD(P)-dependent dehydrogenase (short-subunit alcohol dehydrogenase family)
VNVNGAGAIVSGGASGLGLATVRALRDAGARVTILDLPTSNGPAIAAGDPGIAFVAGDVRDEAQVTEAVNITVNLRVAVSCAGIGGTHRILGREGVIPEALFRRVIDTNLIGTFNLLRLAAQKIAQGEPVDGERGVIVNTASIAAYEGQIGQSAYAASKAAIVGLTLPAARDLASHLIRVATIAPGVFDTPMLGRLPGEARSALTEFVPHPKRLGRPEEYASLVLHIVTNPMINGEVIRIDGALRMGPR